MRTTSRSIARYESDDALLATPIPERQVVVHRADPLDTANRLVGLLARLTLLAVLVAILVAVLGLIGVGGRATASVGDRIGAAIERSTGALTGVAQSVRDAADPAHPPRAPLAFDTEFEELLKLQAGAQLSGASERTVAFARFERRADAPSPEAAAYAVLHTELRSPREIRIFGVLLRSDRDPRDAFLYKGESIRVGRKLYKVNWVSLEHQQVALTAYRHPDQVTGTLKLEAN